MSLSRDRDLQDHLSRNGVGGTSSRKGAGSETFKNIYRDGDVTTITTLSSGTRTELVQEATGHRPIVLLQRDQGFTEDTTEGVSQVETVG